MAHFKYMEKADAMAPSMRRRILLDLIGILSIGLVLVVANKLSPLLFPVADRQLAAPPCDLQRAACRSELPDGSRIELAFAERPAPLVRPFAVAATVDGPAPAKIEIDFAGLDMDMGLNRKPLQAAGAGRYVAQVVLPVCISGGMRWRATLLIERNGQRLALPYEFTTGS